MTDVQTYTIDATGKRLGRVATEAASVLMGKHKPSFVRHIDESVRVEVKGVEKLDIAERKRVQKIYKRYSGHPGGQTETPMHKVIEKHGVRELVKKAVYGMLPNNKMRTPRMKRLVIED